MRLARWDRRLGSALGVLALACGGGGGGGGTGPCTPGPVTQLVVSGDQQDWYFSNPLPTPYSVNARDASNCPVSGVVVTWTVASGGGSVAPDQSTTSASGVTSAVHTLGPTAQEQTVTATAPATGLAPVTFTAHASAPPPSAAVSVNNDFFSPNAVVIQTGGTVTWTWNSGTLVHDVDYDGGPMPLPTGSGVHASPFTHSNTIMTVGKYTYHCNIHSGMRGSVTVVQ